MAATLVTSDVLGQTPDQPPAQAPTPEACFSAAEKAQPLMKQRKLATARRFLQVCASDECPRAVRSDCKGWLDDVTTAQPTVVFVAREERPDGASVAIDDVRVSADGSALGASRLDGTAVALDPGMHTLTFEHAGFDPVEQRVDVREGERDRQVDVVFRPAAGRPGAVHDGAIGPAQRHDGEAPRPVAWAPVPALAYGLGAGAVVALGLGVTLEAVGLSDRAHLESTCKMDRSCDPSAVNAARTRVAIGDVALGAGALLLAGAAYVYFTRAPERTSSALRLRIGPIAGGATAGIEGSL